MSPPSGSPAPAVAGEVSAADLWAQIEAGAAPVLLDVRSRAEFARGHVPGARHVPFWIVRWRLRTIPASRHDPVVVYCGHGPRAWMAGAALRRRGFTNVKYLAGHFSQWHREGRPEERPRAAMR